MQGTPVQMVSYKVIPPDTISALERSAYVICLPYHLGIRHLCKMRAHVISMRRGAAHDDDHSFSLNIGDAAACFHHFKDKLLRVASS